MGACCCSWAYGALTSANEYLISDESVHVLTDSKGHIVFEPLNLIVEKPFGVIFYPGVIAEPKAYSEIAHSLAENGYFTVLCKMPCNTAAFSTNKAIEIASFYGDRVEKWVVGGHSLGGVMLTKMINENYNKESFRSKFIGLFLLGARGYYDISETNIKAIVIYGDLDRIIGKDLVEAS